MGDKGSPVEGDDQYALLLNLEELESVLEELEEAGISSGDTAHLPPNLREQMEDLGLGSVGELKEKIARAHQTLDAEEL